MDVVLNERLLNVTRKLLVKQVDSELPLVPPGVTTLLGLLRTTAVTRASMRPRCVELSVPVDSSFWTCQRRKAVACPNISQAVCMHRISTKYVPNGVVGW